MIDASSVENSNKAAALWVAAVDGSEAFAEHALPQICEARKLSGRLGPVAVLLAGPDGEDAQRAGQYGADMATVVTPAAAATMPASFVAARIVDMFRQQTPRLMFFAATRRGEEIAGLVAARLSLPVIHNIVGLKHGDEDQFLITKPEHGGKVIRTVETTPGCPLIVTAKSDVFALEPADTTRQITLTQEPWDIPADEPDAVRVLEVLDEAPGAQDLSEARVVVGCGAGLGGQENLPMMEELATLLGGTIGATRVAVDAGWLPFAKQIGQTGKTIAPNLYIACGISGVSHHVAGVQGAKLIVAINKDPNAQMIKMADLAVIGDLLEVIPEMISEIRRRKDIAPSPNESQGQPA